MSIQKLFLTSKTTPVGDLFVECVRWNLDVLQLSDGDEGEPFQAVIVLRGDDTKHYLEAISETYDRLNEDELDPCFD